MKRVRKLGVTLCLMFGVIVALAIGLVYHFKTNNPFQVGNVSEVENDFYIDMPELPVARHFEAGTVKMQKGGDTLNYEYNPTFTKLDEGTVAYKYVFMNTMNRATAVNLKELDDTDVDVTYTWKVNDEIDVDNDSFDTYDDYVCVTLPNKGDKLYVYILVSPTKENIPVEFTSSVRWWYGIPKQLAVINAATNETKYQTIVTGQKIDKNTLLPQPATGENFEGWFLDKECTQPLEGEIKPGKEMYVRYWNLPENKGWLTEDGDHYVVTKGEGDLPNNLVIPAYYNGLPVTHIADGDIAAALGGDFNTLVFGQQMGITSISLPSTMTYVGAGAFLMCTGLTDVVLPDSIETINVGAFGYCFGLKSVKLPKNLTAILPLTFAECPSLTYVDASYSNITAITGDEENGLPGPFMCSGDYGASALQTINLTGCNQLMMFGYGAFATCGSLSSVEIPSSVMSIGEWAFNRCGGLTSITFGENSALTSIGEGAFRYCDNLISMIIPSGVTGIGEYAFEGCGSLTSIVIPSSVTSIGSSAFYECSSLTSIVIPSSVTSISDYAFRGCSSLTSITIPSSVTSIGSGAFSGCSSLTSIIIPSSVTSIGQRAFEGCSSLTSIVIPSGVTSIGSYAFATCGNLTNITIPSSVTSIGDAAFSGCSSLTSITIPSSVTSIGYYAFNGCSSLTSIKFEDMGYFWQANGKLFNVYNPTANATVFKFTYVDYTCTKSSQEYDPATYTNLSSDWYVYDQSLGGYKVVDGGTLGVTDVVLASKYQKDNYPKANVVSIGEYAFQNCSGLTSITIPSSVTSIGGSSFFGCSSLTSIVIPSGVTSIGSSAFSRCSSLTSIVIPSGVTSIGNYTFAICSGLTSITIPSGVTSIGSYAFQNCSGLTSIVIPSSVTSIGDFAFHECSSLTSITIPEGVTSIGYKAFDGCSALEELTFATGGTWCYTDSGEYTGGDEFTIVEGTDYKQTFVSDLYNKYWYKK